MRGYFSAHVQINRTCSQHSPNSLVMGRHVGQTCVCERESEGERERETDSVNFQVTVKCQVTIYASNIISHSSSHKECP